MCLAASVGADREWHIVIVGLAIGGFVAWHRPKGNQGHSPQPCRPSSLGLRPTTRPTITDAAACLRDPGEGPQGKA